MSLRIRVHERYDYKDWVRPSLAGKTGVCLIDSWGILVSHLYKSGKLVSEGVVELRWSSFVEKWISSPRSVSLKWSVCSTADKLMMKFKKSFNLSDGASIHFMENDSNSIVMQVLDVGDLDKAYDRNNADIVDKACSFVISGIDADNDFYSSEELMGLFLPYQTSSQPLVYTYDGVNVFDSRIKDSDTFYRKIG